VPFKISLNLTLQRGESRPTSLSPFPNRGSGGIFPCQNEGLRRNVKGIAVAWLIMTSIFLLAPLPGMAEDSQEELDKRIAACNQVMRNVLGMPDRGIPRDLLRRCRGVAVFPRVFKAGVVVGVGYGNGVVLRRDENSGEWSKPAFFKIREGSIGVQAGAQSVDLILLIMSDEAMEGLLEDKYALGADISVAAGPVGREASAETNIRFDAGILSYSRSRGLFAGMSLKGASLEPDKEANAVYHGQGVSVQDVFYENSGALSDSGRTLIETLEDALK
jgi:SH3 domain-containing YSC84-like protein 1